MGSSQRTPVMRYWRMRKWARLSYDSARTFRVSLLWPTWTMIPTRRSSTTLSSKRTSLRTRACPIFYARSRNSFMYSSSIQRQASCASSPRIQCWRIITPRDWHQWEASPATVMFCSEFNHKMHRRYTAGCLAPWSIDTFRIQTCLYIFL